MAKKGWIMTKAFHPTAFEKGVYIIDFRKKGKPRVDRNLKRFQIKAKTKTEAIRKARSRL